MQSLTIADGSQVGEARRTAAAAALALDLSEEEAGRVALAATELATNILKHAGGGEILLSSDGQRVRLIALDKGPGMADLGRCLADGYSTASTAGGGLGAIRRAADEFAVDTRPGRGTAVLCSVGPEPEAAGAGVEIAAVCIAKAGEIACGDNWAAAADGPDRLDLMVADGLGHGPMAATASGEAVRVFLRPPRRAPAEMVNVLHDALRPTRGAAVAACRIDRTRGSVTFAGIGNIAGTALTDGRMRKMVSLNGVAGHNARKISAFDYPYTPGSRALVILHSDGLSSGWSLDAYPGLQQAHPALIAAVLYRDFGRSRDDATVVVARMGPS